MERMTCQRLTFTNQIKYNIIKYNRLKQRIQTECTAVKVGPQNGSVVQRTHLSELNEPSASSQTAPQQGTSNWLPLRVTI